MASRSLNKVQLIGNLTRDPELRYTPTGAAVCTIGLATNRYWTTESGEKKEETEFHRVVAWNKLAELCSQLLTKGRKVYVEGRLRTNSWTAQDGTQKTTTEVVIDDMILLDSRRPPGMGEPTHEAGEGGATESGGGEPKVGAGSVTTVAQPAVSLPAQAGKKKSTKTEEGSESSQKEEINPDDIPF
jgi:single-strand DNA-binding protein